MMATKSKPKPKPADSPNLTTLDEPLSDMEKLLALSNLVGDVAYWSDLIRDGASDQQIRAMLKSLWLLGATSEDPLAYASGAMGPCLVWFGQDHSKGSPSLSGDALIEAVRDLLEIPLPGEEWEARAGDPGNGQIDPAATRDVPAMVRDQQKRASAAKAKANGKAGGAHGKNGAQEKSPTAADLLAGVEVIEERDVSLCDIWASKDNPREAFDEQLIAEMSENIVQICLLNPLTIRESGELIDGETRQRAAVVAKAASLRCKVVRCTDAQAAAIRLLTAVQRRDLNPIERARALKALQEKHGLSQRQLADVVHLEQGTISSLTRLLDLPRVWQDRVKAQEITATDARHLMPWSDVPEVMAEVEKLKKQWGGSWVGQLARLVAVAAENRSRPMKDDYYWDGRLRKVDLKPGDEQREQLRIRKVNGSNRAFNVQLWEELQKADEAKRAAAAAKRGDKADAKTKTLSAAERKKADRKKAEQLKARLFDFKIQWHWQMIGAEQRNLGGEDMIPMLLFLLSTSAGPRSFEREDGLDADPLLNAGKKKKAADDLLARLLNCGDNAHALARNFLKAEFAVGVYKSAFDSEQVLILSEVLGVDMKKQWSASFADDGPCRPLWEFFLGLFTKAQLLEVFEEWKIKVPAGTEKLSELHALASPSKPCPKAILEASR